VIVTPRPGFYNIGESANSPIVFIGKCLRSTYGIIVGEEDEFDRFRRASEINVTKKDIDEEIIDEEIIDEEIIDEETIHEELIDKEEIAEEDIWIPYQEFRAPVNRLVTTKTTPNTSRSSKWQAYISMPSETHAFIHPTPEEVLYYMLESIEEFHSGVYGSFLQRSRHSGLDFLNLLRPEALRVLSSGNYSRDK
jgi:hypothetical protein